MITRTAVYFKMYPRIVKMYYWGKMSQVPPGCCYNIFGGTYFIPNISSFLWVLLVPSGLFTCAIIVFVLYSTFNCKTCWLCRNKLTDSSLRLFLTGMKHRWWILWSGCLIDFSNQTQGTCQEFFSITLYLECKCKMYSAAQCYNISCID